MARRAVVKDGEFARSEVRHRLPGFLFDHGDRHLGGSQRRQDRQGEQQHPAQHRSTVTWMHGRTERQDRSGDGGQPGHRRGDRGGAGAGRRGGGRQLQGTEGGGAGNRAADRRSGRPCDHARGGRHPQGRSGSVGSHGRGGSRADRYPGKQCGHRPGADDRSGHRAGLG